MTLSPLRHALRSLSAAALSLLVATPTIAGVVHDEATDGDISGNSASPTVLAFEVGTNTVKGSVVGAVDVRDFMTFTIPAGSELTAIQMVQYEHLTFGGAGNTGYHSLNVGATSQNPNMSNGSFYLGGDHVAGFQAGTDVLPVLASAPLAGTGFTPPLAAGTYTYLIQQTGGNDPTGYTIDFVVECSSPAASAPYGAGKPGTVGVPTLSSTQLPVIGVGGDLVVGNGLPSAAPVILFVGFAAAALPFDGGTLLTVPVLTLNLPPLSPAGTLTLPFPLPADPSLCGVSTFMQVIFVDPGAGGFYQTAQTNGLQLTFGS